MNCWAIRLAGRSRVAIAKKYFFMASVFSGEGGARQWRVYLFAKAKKVKNWCASVF